MSKPKYKAVIFDFDDTLVESRAQKWAQHIHIAKKFFDIDLTEEIIRKHWGKPIHVLAREIYQNKDSWENIHLILRGTRRNFPKKMYEKALDTVEKILDSGIKVGILSAATTLDVEDDLIRFDFPINRFTIIQGAEKTVVHKPDPDVFSPVFEELRKEGVEKNDIVYVGDSLDDFKGAKEAGIDFIAVTTGLYSQDDFKKNGAEVIITNINELLNKLND